MLLNNHFKYNKLSVLKLFILKKNFLVFSNIDNSIFLKLTQIFGISNIIHCSIIKKWVSLLNQDFFLFSGNTYFCFFDNFSFFFKLKEEFIMYISGINYEHYFLNFNFLFLDNLYNSIYLMIFIFFFIFINFLLGFIFNIVKILNFFIKQKC